MSSPPPGPSSALSLRQRLFRSHMWVAALGLGMLLVMLVVTTILRAHALRLAQLRGPTARNSTLALQGVQRSLAGLRGWMAVGDDEFKRERARAWSEDILPALAALEDLDGEQEDPSGRERLAVIRVRLRHLNQAQWWIEDVAQTPGDQPARVRLEQEAAPIFQELATAATAIINIERDLPNGAARKLLLGAVADFRAHLSDARAALGVFVEDGRDSDLTVLQDELAQAADCLADAGEQRALLTPDQRELMAVIHDQFTAYLPISADVVSARQSEEWSVARHRLQHEAVPLASEATRMLQALSREQQRLMASDARLVTNLSNLALLIGIVLISAMFVAAVMLARRSSAQLAAPIAQLSEATRNLAERNLDHDLPITSRDELGSLTRSFNSMRRSLARSEADSRAVIESTPAGIIMADSEGTIVLANAKALELFGYEVEQLLGQPVEILVPEELREVHLGHRERFAQSPEERAMGEGRDLFALRRDGRRFPVEIALTPIETPEGTRVLATVIDISMRKKTESLLRDQAARLERSNAELDQFAYVASHDLKSPLRAIRNLAQWIGEDAGEALPEDSQKDLALMQERVTRMESLLDSLLQYSRVGRKEDAPGEVDVRQLVEDLAATLDVPEGFEIAIEGDLPTLRAPRGALNRVFGNLIANALKHHDRQEGVIRISCEDAGTFHRFAIADDGPGIAEEFQERVFVMFQTLRPRDEVEGTGMGLALVKKTVEIHGGKVTLESAPGEGTTFRFTWPKDPIPSPSEQSS